MADVLAEVNFAALQDPRGAIFGPEGICAGLVAFLEATGDALSCAGRISVGLLAFLLLLGSVVFLLAAGTLCERGEAHQGGKCEQRLPSRSAVAVPLNDRHPDSRWISSIRFERMAAFRERFRNTNVLVIDGRQSLGGYEKRG